MNRSVPERAGNDIDLQGLRSVMTWYHMIWYDIIWYDIICIIAYSYLILLLLYMICSMTDSVSWQCDWTWPLSLKFGTLPNLVIQSHRLRVKCMYSVLSWSIFTFVYCTWTASESPAWTLEVHEKMLNPLLFVIVLIQQVGIQQVGQALGKCICTLRSPLHLPSRWQRRRPRILQACRRARRQSPRPANSL